MKKLLVSTILGLAAVASVHAQGSIVLYNYNATKLIQYGANSGGTLGASVTASTPFTVGFYYATGDQTAAVNGALTGDGGNGLVPTLALFSGANGTATIGTDQPGRFSNQTTAANLGVAGGTTVTIVIVAYNGASYANSTVRGHSSAFTLTAQASPNPAPDMQNGAWTSFSVSAVPEPSTFALAGLGLAGLLIFRRRK